MNKELGAIRRKFDIKDNFYNGFPAELLKDAFYLLAEIDRLQAELEGAVFQLSGDCESCVFLPDCYKHDKEGWIKDCEDWQWRGAERGTGDE